MSATNLLQRQVADPPRVRRHDRAGRSGGPGSAVRGPSAVHWWQRGGLPAVVRLHPPRVHSSASNRQGAVSFAEHVFLPVRRPTDCARLVPHIPRCGRVPIQSLTARGRRSRQQRPRGPFGPATCDSAPSNRMTAAATTSRRQGELVVSAASSDWTRSRGG